MFEPRGFSETIFRQRYAFTENESWNGACERVARQVSLAESPDKQQLYFDRFYEVLVNNYFVPGGRIWYGSGRTTPSLLNCFVLSDNKDSREGWAKLAYDMIVTSMCGGGCGIDFSDIRPRGASISSTRGEAPGAVELMRLIDGCAKPVKSGGNRRAALLFSLDLDHPDIEEFLSAKLTKGELTHANISVRSKCTKEFIKAVQSDGEWELSWKGKYKKTVKAKELWKLIVTNAYNSGEPGFLNWELVEADNTIGYNTKLVTTNPCGEIPMQEFSNCCLGHLVLSRFVFNGEINYELLGNTIRTAVRFLDNVLSVNHYPLPEMKVAADNFRRIGLGTTGLADMLVLTGLKYGSEESFKFVDKLFRFISKIAYESSVMLAIEKGAFPLCDPKKHIESGYVKRMTTKIKSFISEHGIRNSAILTQAPTGTVSILSGNCSAGIEPIFSVAYERRYWDKDVRKTELVFHPLFEQFINEGKDVSHFIGSHDLTVREHLEMQKIVQRHIDNAVSKTINIPKDYPMEDVEQFWLEYLPHIKGVTFYREGTRGYVNDKGETEDPPLKALSFEEAKKRFSEQHKVEAVTSNDCVSGVCELT